MRTNNRKIPHASSVMSCCISPSLSQRRRRLSPLRLKRPLLPLVVTLSISLCFDARNLAATSAFQPSSALIASTRLLQRDVCFFRDSQPRIARHGTTFHQPRIRLFVSSTDTATESSAGPFFSNEEERVQTPSIVHDGAKEVLVSGESQIVNGASNQTSINGVLASNQTNVNGIAPPVGNSTAEDIPLPTVNGGYSHTTASRAKISAANKGKVPWNKGRTRSPEERARIAAGVRAKNRQRFLEKLEKLGLTEEEYNEQKKAERRRKDQERRARKTAKGGYRPTEETKQKISAILKEKWAKGEMKKRTVNPEKVRRGFTHSAETRAKISASLKKRWAEDADYRNAMMQKCNTSNSSEDVKQRISASLKKKWQDPEFRQEMLGKMANRRQQPGPHGMTHREKISAAMKKKWQDEEYRKKTIAGIQKSQALKPKRPKAKPKKKATAPKEVTAVQPVDGIRVAKPVQPKKKAPPVKNKKKRPVTRATPAATAAKKRAPRKVKPIVESSPTEDEILLQQQQQEEKAAALKAEQDGSIKRLREERRDLYDLLYGEDGASSAVLLDLGDENLDTFDPYGLEDF